MTEYTPEQIAELKRRSDMLGRIAAWTSDFCDDEINSTEEAVVNLLALYHSAKANESFAALERMQKERKQTDDN